jgi:cyclohexyl-isocyanide hydratase
LPQSRFHIVFPIFPGVTQLDFAAPYEVFSRLPGIRLTLASHSGGKIESSSGLIVDDVKPINEVEHCDLICVPGGPGADAALEDDPLLSEVRRLATMSRYVTSVCTGSLILGAVGMLDGKRATSHWHSLELLALFGAIPVRERVVRDGNVFTGAGVTSGLDFALTVAAEIASLEAAQEVQLAIEYAPEPPFAFGSPDTAPPAITAKVRAQVAEGLMQRRLVVEEAAARMRDIRRAKAEAHLDD